MNTMIDGNTAALNRHLLEEDEAEAKAEIEADDRKMELDEKVLRNISQHGEATLEAVGTEATMIAINKLDPIFIDLFVEAIECDGRSGTDEALGKFVRERGYGHIAGSL